ncbi:MAG: hypothetical protein IPJ23_03170 [Ignavibacteriales bacterium]|nr:hypothetical protein [Ignavibacteriales bacterium]
MNKVILILIVSISFTSCDLFTTRDAENPDQTRSNFQPAVEPSIVIENLKNSFFDKNVQNYISCFVDTIFAERSFNFSASSEALSLYQIFCKAGG